MEGGRNRKNVSSGPNDWPDYLQHTSLSSKMFNACKFAVLDVSSGLWQVTEHICRHFSGLHWKCCFYRLFELWAASKTQSRKINDFSHILQHTKVYIYYILVLGKHKSEPENDQNVWKNLERISCRSKSKQTTITFLWYHLSMRSVTSTLLHRVIKFSE